MIRLCKIVCLVILIVVSVIAEDDGVKFATPCEVCKLVSRELEERLKETGKTSEVIETGYSIATEAKKKRTKYAKSELRLLESLDGLCERMLQYNIHKEREDSTRFAKGMSQTFQTLHGLVAKGVKVDLGIPQELWDKPSAEITHLKTQCETFLEDYEDLIQDWYNSQDEGDVKLVDYVCKRNVLAKKDQKCLSEPFDVPADKSKKKGETGSGKREL